MTRKEFDEMERLCKEEWRELAETGNARKSERVMSFINCCPACHIASGNTGSYDELNCGRCPVDVWRESAEDFSCQGPDAKELYGLWIYSEDDEERKLLAKQISELEWSWLPEYAEM